MEAAVQSSKFRGLPFMPSWYHHHGLKMKVLGLPMKRESLSITNHAALVVIEQIRDAQANRDICWRIIWQINHSSSDDEAVTGYLEFTNEDLSIAFDLTEQAENLNQGNEDGCFTKQGKYFRFKNFLNIPCPGTGDNGDPNISIYLSKEIKDAIRQFIG